MQYKYTLHNFSCKYLVNLIHIFCTSSFNSFHFNQKVGKFCFKVSFNTVSVYRSIDFTKLSTVHIKGWMAAQNLPFSLLYVVEYDTCQNDQYHGVLGPSAGNLNWIATSKFYQFKKTSNKHWIDAAERYFNGELNKRFKYDDITETFHPQRNTVIAVSVCLFTWTAHTARTFKPA